MATRSPQSIVKAIPPLPAAVAKLGQAAQLEVADVLKIVSCDPAIAARVLKVSNSSFYGRRGRVLSLREGVITLGVHTVKSLAIGLAVAGLHKRLVLDPKLALAQARYWRCSIATSVAASEIARSLRLSCRDECFTGGLVRQVGQLGMMGEFGAGYASFLAPQVMESPDFALREERAFGLSHVEVGQAMCEQWKLPEPLTALVGQSSDQPLAEVVELSRALAEFAGFGGLGSQPINLELIRGLLERRPAALEDVSDGLEEGVAEAESTLGISAEALQGIKPCSVEVKISDPASASLVRLAIRGLGCEVDSAGAWLVGDSAAVAESAKPALDVARHGLSEGKLTAAALRRGLSEFLGGAR